MATRELNPSRRLGREYVDLEFSFAPAGAGAPTDVRGIGVASVVRSSQGLFLVTLENVWFELVSAVATIQSVAAAARYAQLGVVDLAARTIQVRSLDGAGAVQDIAADANSRIHVRLALRDSSWSR